MRRSTPAILAIACALTTGACASTSALAPPPAAAPTAGPCSAEGAHWAIGRAVDQGLVNQVLRDTGSRTARVVEPGQVVTMDYDPERVSIHVNERGAINAIKCG